MQCFSKTDHVVERNVRHEHILVPISSGSARMDCLYTLNETAAEIWRQAIAGEPDMRIAQHLAAVFDVEQETAMDDTCRILSELVAIGALKPLTPGLHA